MTRKRIRLTEVARTIWNCSPDTARKKAREAGLTIFRLRDTRTSPDYLYKSELDAYERRTSVLDSDLSYGAERRGSQYARR